MKRILALLFFLIALNAGAQSLESDSRFQIDTIDFPGQRHVFLLYDTPLADSIIETGTRQISGVTLAHVGRCTYRMSVRDTVLVETKVTVKGRKASKRLTDYFELLSGTDLAQDRGGFEFIPVRTIEHNGVPLLMELQRNRLRFRRKTTLLLTSDVENMLLEIN